MHVHDASKEVEAATLAGPHRGWETWDCKLEGSRFHLIHGAVSGGVFDAVEAERLACELAALARSYGYGAADGFLSDVHGMTQDEIEADPVRTGSRSAIFEDPEDHDPYFAEIRKSEAVLDAAAATPEASAFVRGGPAALPASGGALHSRMLESYRSGRDLRASQEEVPRPAGANP